MSFFYVDNSLVEHSYNSDDNYIIRTSNNECSCCAIYFSSNAIYYPDTEEAFEHIICRRNKFEWYGTNVKRASKHIFLRDVHKQWYLKGINSSINSQQKILSFLQQETKEYDEIITIGSSAGGYAAILYGCLLNAKIIIAFSPQYNLNLLLGQKKWPYIEECIVSQNDKWLNLDNVVKSSISNIFYVYPEKSKVDIPHYELIKNKDKINFIYITSDLHGVPLLKKSLIKIINSKKEPLERISGIHVKNMDRKILGTCFFFIATIRDRLAKVVKNAMIKI